MALAAVAAIILVCSVYAQSNAGGGTDSALQTAAAALSLAGAAMLVPWRLFMLRRWAAVVIVLGPAVVTAFMFNLASTKPYAWDPNASAVLLAALVATVVLLGTVAITWRDLKPGL